MITAKKHTNYVLVVIHDPDRLESWEQIKAIPSYDRELHEGYRWHIKNPEKYTHIKAIAAALSDAERQLKLL